MKLGAGARESLIRRAGVKRIREIEIASVAEPAGGKAVDLFPEKVRGFARLSRTVDPAYPYRVTLRLRNEDEVERLARFLARLVPLA